MFLFFQSKDKQLLEACKQGYVQKVSSLVIKKKANVQYCDDAGWTPLHWASYNGHTETVKLLIDNNADVNAIGQSFGWTPLHLASKNGHTETAKLLIDNKSEINAMDKNGWTPLHMASYNDHMTTANMLIDNGANVLAKTNDTIDEETAKLLFIRKGASYILNKYGWTPLHLASKNGHTTIAKLLIDNKANINAVNKLGETPLFVASDRGHITTAKLLIDNGANVLAKTNNGKLPMDLAKGSR